MHNIIPMKKNKIKVKTEKIVTEIVTYETIDGFSFNTKKEAQLHLDIC